MNASQKMFAGIIRRFDMARSSKKYLFKKTILRLRYRRKVEWCDNTHPSYLAAIFFRARANITEEGNADNFRGVNFPQVKCCDRL